MLDDNLLLTQKPDVDYQTLPETPSPEEFFLLSRVTGVVSVQQLCAASGLGRNKTLKAIERLMDFGLLEEAEGVNAAPSQPASDPEPAPEPEPEEDGDDLFGPDEAPQPSPGFETVSPDDDDDLFEVGSPAHKSNVKGVSGLEARASDDVSQTDPGFDRPSDEERVMSASLDEPTAEAALDEKTAPGDQATDEEARRAAQAQAAQDKPKPEEPSPQREARGRGKKLEKVPPDYSAFPVSPDEYDVDESRLEPESEMAIEAQREIIYVHDHLDEITHYDLFAVDTDEERKTIRKAYFTLSKRFHPDLYFRKNVGTFATMVEDIFKHVTGAYQTLSHKKKRAQYDERLGHRDREREVTEARSADEEQRKRDMAFRVLQKRAGQAEEAGDFLEAAGHLRKALALQRSGDMMLSVAELLLRANQKLDEAATFARAVLKEDDENVDALVLLGRIYEQNELYDDAMSMLERAAELAPDDPSIQVHAERIRSAAGLEDA